MASLFDNSDTQPVADAAPAVKSAQSAQSAQSVFSDEDTHPLSTKVAASSVFDDHDTAPVQSLTPRPDEQHLRETNTILPEEIEKTAAKYPGADPAFLRSIVPYLGAFTSTEPGDQLMEAPKRIAGIAGRGALNLPQWALKKLQDEPTQKAWDELQELANQRKTGLMKASEFVGELGTGFGVFGALGKASSAVRGAASAAPIVAEGAAGAVKTLAKGAAEGAAIGVAGHVAESKTGEETEGLTSSGAIGALIGGILHIPGAYGRAVGASIGKEGTQIAARTAKEMETPEAQQEVKAGLDTIRSITSDTSRLEDLSPEAKQDLVGFSSYIENSSKLPETVADLPKAKTVEAAAEHVSSWAAEGRGQNYLEQEFRNFKAVQKSQEISADALARGTIGATSTPLSKLGRSALRATAQFGALDDRSGSALEPAVNDLAMNANSAVQEVVAQLDKHSEALDAIRKTLRNVPIEVQKAAEFGDRSGLTEEQRTAWDGAQKMYKDLFGRINELAGEEIVTKVEGATDYSPHMQLDEQSTVQAVRRAARAVEEKAGVSLLDGAVDISDEATAKASKEAPNELNILKEQLTKLTGDHPTTSAELQRALRGIVDPEGFNSLVASKANRKAAGALLERGEVGIPDSLRETDLYKTAVRYMDSVFKNVYTRDTMQEIVKQRGFLQSAGDVAGLEYLDSWLGRARGGGVGLPSWMAKMRATQVAKLADRADQLEAAGKGAQAEALRTLAANSDLPGAMMSSIYPNLMGARPSSVLKPLLAPFVATMPELMGGGTAWGMAKMAGGIARTIKQLATQPLQAMKMLAERGFMPTRLTAEAQDAWHAGMREGAGGALRTGLDAWNHLMMSGMQAGESLNRLIAINTAPGIVSDIMAGSEASQRFMARLGRGYQSRFEALIRAGDRETLTGEVEKYMVGKTLQQYSPLHMSEMGRHFGRIVGALSTWPTSVAGDVVRDYARRGAFGGTAATARKYLAPWAALGGIQHLLNAGGWNPEESPRAKALVGAEGLAGAAPGKEGLKMLTGGFTSPLIQDVGHTLADVVSMDPNRWWQAANKVGEHYTPVLPALVRLLDTTLPGVISNREAPPKGETLTGRSLDLLKPGSGQRVDEAIRAQSERARSSLGLPPSAQKGR